MSYKDELTKAMTMLGERDEVVFMGQAVRFPGTGMFGTLEGVPMEKRIELPVMEDAQLGMALGMSLRGLLPVCIYPRVNFLLLAMNQLVNHLEKLPQFSEYGPQVIIRTMTASASPLNPGVQHLGDYTAALKRMLRIVRVVELRKSEEVVPQYQRALLRRNVSTLLIERADRYEK